MCSLHLCHHFVTDGKICAFVCLAYGRVGTRSEVAGYLGVWTLNEVRPDSIRKIIRGWVEVLANTRVGDPAL